MQNQYYSQHFPEATLSETAQKKNELMKQLAVQNTIDALIGDGLKANVTDKLNDILLRAVTSNAKFADLQEELRAHLLGTDGGIIFYDPQDGSFISFDEYKELDMLYIESIGVDNLIVDEDKLKIIARSL